MVMLTQKFLICLNKNGIILIKIPLQAEAGFLFGQVHKQPSLPAAFVFCHLIPVDFSVNCHSSICHLVPVDFSVNCHSSICHLIPWWFFCQLSFSQLSSHTLVAFLSFSNLKNVLQYPLRCMPPAHAMHSAPRWGGRGAYIQPFCRCFIGRPPQGRPGK